MNTQSVLDLARGAIKERTEVELQKIIENITDPNTDPKKKRQMQITIDFLPDAERQTISLNTVVKSKLEPTHAISTGLYLTGDAGGMVAVELTPQIPGQTNLDGEVQGEPVKLRLAQ